ncbi:hypothetical protein ROB62_007156 [Pseudomonas aeruginosa]|nr:hypothetical protein [Pseudomonas aeruginosa]
MVATVHAGGDAFSSLTDLLNCNTGYAEVRLRFIHNRGQQAFIDVFSAIHLILR